MLNRIVYCCCCCFWFAFDVCCLNYRNVLTPFFYCCCCFAHPFCTFLIFASISFALSFSPSSSTSIFRFFFLTVSVVSSTFSCTSTWIAGLVNHFILFWGLFLIIWQLCFATLRSWFSFSPFFFLMLPGFMSVCNNSLFNRYLYVCFFFFSSVAFQKWGPPTAAFFSSLSPLHVFFPFHILSM